MTSIEFQWIRLMQFLSNANVRNLLGWLNDIVGRATARTEKGVDTLPSPLQSIQGSVYDLGEEAHDGQALPVS